MYSPKIKALHDEYCELIDFCREHNQVSFEMYINDTYRKSLLLSAASYFEAQISNAVHAFSVNASKGNKSLVAFVDNKAINRQYHTFFDWKGNNANQFLGLFGEDFKKNAKDQIKEKELENAEREFITLGKERNCLVHQNYIEAQVNSTFEEIYNRYETACDFVEFIVQILNHEV